MTRTTVAALALILASPAMAQDAPGAVGRFQAIPFSPNAKVEGCASEALIIDTTTGDVWHWYYGLTLVGKAPHQSAICEAHMTYNGRALPVPSGDLAQPSKP
jgi:hypothetical protein